MGEIGEIGELQTGNTPTKKDRSLYNGEIPFIKPADITNQGINYATEDTLSCKGIEKGRIANKGDILITCIGNLGRNFHVNRKVAFNQQINSISPILGNHVLLHYFLETNFFVKTMYKNASATTLSILNKTKLSNLILPLPPLNEQKRIAAKIEELFTVIDSTAS
ncbi:restriction endonuclease subunit S [Lactobacillus sp. PV012]|uniref:restriction endonuclease subunit S n=1 Tax=Lactobacillus sp. PV012 TaxID=2594494 RepID=UPI00223EF679|nr:restriction endonuclease subunit S [Lactobacillus sp. PV012]